MLCQDYVDECPVENGFFADAVQCDRYYECKNGEVSFCFVIFKTTVVYRKAKDRITHLHFRPTFCVLFF